MIWNTRLNIILSVFVFLISALASFVFFMVIENYTRRDNDTTSKVPVNVPFVPDPTPTKPPIPLSYIMPLKTHVFQSYNNCGPAALSMALSYYGINKTQAEIGNALRPYQVPGGDNDDKSVTLEEVAEKSKEFGLTPYLRPNGNIEIIKQFVALDIPVMARTWTTPSEDIGHYRIVRGYNESGILQDDSLQDKNLWYTNEDFNAVWKKFNYEYLVLAPENKIAQVEAIIGEDVDEKIAWIKAVANAEKELSRAPDDVYARFNLSVSYYYSGNYSRSVEEFEKIENDISFRTLWYQIEPIEAYYRLENYTRVFAISDRILNNHNRAFSELYMLRGNIYLNQGDREAARDEFEKAVLYNTSMKEAQDALESLRV